VLSVVVVVPAFLGVGRAKYEKRVVGDWRETMAKAVVGRSGLGSSNNAFPGPCTAMCIARTGSYSVSEFRGSGGGAAAFCLRVYQ
jgi:hypothetical protein